MFITTTVDGTAGADTIALSVGSGDILVTGQGLTSSTASLQLIAGRIKIDGPVRNTSSDPNANINVVAGNAQVVLDSSLLPGGSLHPRSRSTACRSRTCRLPTAPRWR